MSVNEMLMAAAGSAGGAAEYVEDVFSTYLYTGNGSTQTITNGIDLASEGGLVWGKNRDANWGHYLADTAQGTGKFLSSDKTDATALDSTSITAFNSNGFSIGDAGAFINNNNVKYASWTFRKAKKFFDVVTYTGNGSARTISHNLDSVPGMIIVKRTDTTGAWQVYHRANTAAPETDYLVLNTTAATADSDTRWNDTLPTSTVFSLGTDATVNANGGTYVAYLFAHNAGGFGTAGTDNVISCGSYTGNGSSTGPIINLGYEPQFVIAKAASTTGDWFMVDTMRGQGVDSSTSNQLKANTSDAEGLSNFIAINATGFQLTASVSDKNGSGQTYIYMAIRRPMKTPTSGTDVYKGITRTGDGATTQTDTGIGFPPDLAIIKARSVGTNSFFYDRLRGNNKYLLSDNSDAEADGGLSFTSATGSIVIGGDNGWHTENGRTIIDWYFKRATGFFDIVCYTGTGANRTITHNLGAVPELMIVKPRDSIGTSWTCYSSALANTEYIFLNTTGAKSTGATRWNSTTPTSSVFSVGTSTTTNDSGVKFVAYLFATVAGVSKVGSYTGNGSTQTINCGFTAGARFVLIKRTDSTGDWYVYDTARGIVSGNDPQLKLNTADAEATGYDAVDPANSGFIVNNDATNFPINVNNATYIFLAIA